VRAPVLFSVLLISRYSLPFASLEETASFLSRPASCPCFQSCLLVLSSPGRRTLRRLSPSPQQHDRSTFFCAIVAGGGVCKMMPIYVKCMVYTLV